MLSRAYTILEIKSVNDDERLIEGIASTPTPDSDGDVMEPKGAKFTLPMPLLWQHDKNQPIGEVVDAQATSSGIRIKARIAKIDEPGALKDRIDTAWLSLKNKLVKGLSVGWKPIEFARIAQSGGLHVTKWLWAELSAVTIPANFEASITAIKSFDAPFLAASGTEGQGVARPSAGGSASVARASRKGVTPMTKTIAQQIADGEAKRAANVARMNEIMTKSAEDGTIGLNEADSQEYEGLEGEVGTIDTQLKRLKSLEKMQVSSAKPVGGDSPEVAAAARSGAVQQVRVSSPLEPGQEFARAVLCKMSAFDSLMRGNYVDPVALAKAHYPDYPRIQEYLRAKTAVAAGTTTDSNYASALLANAAILEAEFLAYLRPKTIIGKFGTTVAGVSIPSLRRVPFNVKIQSQTSAASASWVGEGKAKPLTKFNTTSTTLLFTKIAAIAVVSDELARFSTPNAELLVRDELARAVIERMDVDFIDPAKAVSSGVNPASITNGVTSINAAGTSAANVLTDVQNLVIPFVEANYDVSGLVLIIPNGLALAASLMLNSLGQRAFPDITIEGGRLAGIPVIASQYAGNANQYGNLAICVSAPDVALADDGRVTVDASREASLEMSDAPAQDATTGGGASMVSMFQTNSIALRAEREVNWKKLRSTAVQYIDDVNWGSIGSPGR